MFPSLEEVWCQGGTQTVGGWCWCVGAEGGPHRSRVTPEARREGHVRFLWEVLPVGPRPAGGWGVEEAEDVGPEPRGRGL